VPRVARPARTSGELVPSVTQGVSQRVLVIDDSPDTLELLLTVFEQKGSQVITAASAEEALRVAAEHTPSFIISDIGMPGMDGYQLLAALRRLPRLAHVPAVAISGYAMEEDRERALRAGFAEHLPKPIDIDHLFALIQKLTA
jgi:two-component system CheB/CheR fusion protein